MPITTTAPKKPAALDDPALAQDRPALPCDEMLDRHGRPHPHCRPYHEWLLQQPPEVLAAKRAEADAIFHRVGITFTVYGEDSGTERLIPFDIIPRTIPRA